MILSPECPPPLPPKCDSPVQNVTIASPSLVADHYLSDIFLTPSLPFIQPFLPCKKMATTSSQFNASQFAREAVVVAAAASLAASDTSYR